MPTRFFTNEGENTLLKKFAGVFAHNPDIERFDALALASVVVDLRVTQLVNGVRGVHAILRHDAITMNAGARLNPGTGLR